MQWNRKAKSFEDAMWAERERADRLQRELDALRTVQEQQLAQLQDADEELVALQEELDRLRNPMAYNPPDQDMFVVVTEASKTKGSHVVKHAWGPYPTRNKAQASAQRFQRTAKEEGHVTKTSVLKIVSS